ncbi:hypothetical protein CAPTEDRAFT_192311 [Capitella teleta]|uniref:Uncharacterized protein n=1 Tax=Capitella teleta TaxID=283909 RepID=R7TAM9_CAPTE|nr:hypothetical protein CAPTEDRAFT_192311 [Capitella teleta]|eukprot:ELT88537.1 hypothetical protein CAPTEDRAFT_192311 [Capitella teleta]
MLSRWSQPCFWALKSMLALGLVLGVLALTFDLTKETSRSSTEATELNLTRWLYGTQDEESRILLPTNDVIKQGFPFFRGRKFKIWNNDLHSSPVQDLKHFLNPFGVEVIHYALDARCKRYFNGQCRGADEIKVINQSSVMDMDDQVITDFYQAYKDDAEMKSIDAFVCFHPAAVCELFLTFNRSLFVIASTRYAAARPEEMRWHTWNWRLARIARSPRNLVAANNRYDVEYMKFYAGIEPELLPSFCGYTNAVYHPTSNSSFLLYAGRYPTTKHNAYFESEWTEACKIENCTGFSVCHFFGAFEGGHSFEEEASFRGVIHIPYQVSTMSFFEQYRMGIPLFAPSLDLLASLDQQFDFVNERNCKDLRKCYHDDDIASIPRHPSAAHLPDPHNKTDSAAIRYWLKFADFYQWPHVIHFDSIADLIRKMKSTNYEDVSRKMRTYNERVETLLLLKWKRILTRVSLHR